MKVKQIFNNIYCEKINVDENAEITSLCLKDSECKQGSAFFCIKGRVVDGKNYVINAKKRGAVVIVTQEYVNNCDIGQIIVKDVRKALNQVCDIFYDAPYKKLKMIGVVGTNGKTSVCEMITEILNGANIPCGKIGTFGASFKHLHYETGFTTPDTHILYHLLNEMIKAGAQTVCMEFSAHAIYYEKCAFRFDVMVFTNCTPEHLDFFGDFEKYRETKLQAFDGKQSKICVVNADDLLGKQITCFRKGAISYGINSPCDVFAIDIEEDSNGTRFLINLFDALYEITTPLYGKFNVYNMLASSTVCALCGVKTNVIADKLSEITAIEGRMQKISGKVNVFVDYAHTKDGLEKALNTLKDIKGENRLICVFGCGGNRDQMKRSEMGKVSGELADFTVITSDNPRFEEEDAIIAQIESGIRPITHEYITIREREDAIIYAIEIANQGDYVLIAGKGAEKYQERMGVYKYFCDREVALKALKRKYD